MRGEEPEAFFARMEPDGRLLARRVEWLDRAPELCLAITDRAHPLVEDCWELARSWGQVERGAGADAEALGRRWEADFILLDGESFVLAGGCVCFPSSWDLQEATGKTLDQVHAVVPRLNDQVGDRIDRFLRGLNPGRAYLRENWGLTRTGERNYHPALGRARIDGGVTLDEVFLRIEHQAFVRFCPMACCWASGSSRWVYPSSSRDIPRRREGCTASSSPCRQMWPLTRGSHGDARESAD